MATILVVDDNAPNREYLQTLLSYKGHRVIVAVDGREALPLIRSERPDLVIADLLMPNMDGFELTRAVRSDAALAHTAIIYCTATYHAREVEMLARSLGVLQIIDKPSEPEAILKLVDAVLAGSVQAAIPVSGLAFDEEHSRLIGEKLTAKMLQLEALNLRLEALTTVGQRLASELDPLCLLQAYCDHGREIFLAKQTTIGILLSMHNENAVESITCSWLAAVVVVGLIAQYLTGAWWVDSVTSLGIVWFLVKEGREAWAGEACGCSSCL